MADSDAERQRRARAHRRGDHTSCDPVRCAARAAPVRVVEGGPGPGGPVETAVLLWTETLDIADVDPRRPLVAAALALSRAVDQAAPGQLPPLVRELRMLTGWMSEFEQQADELDKIRAEVAHRRVTTLLKAL